MGSTPGWVVTFGEIVRLRGMLALETSSLTYQYGNDQVLNQVDLQVPQGSLYGFLGPNGAGKTTTLKLALGLLRNQQGMIRFFGEAFEPNRLRILRRVGSLIESPSLYSHLTARENLRVLQRIHQCPTNRIEAVLSLVGLSQTGQKKAGQFSLGMRQRLAIAMALLHSPEMLILDEPTNGLDPNGIIEMRELLKKLAQDDGITVLISSHLLAEIEKLVTHVGIIHKGKLMFQGRFEELEQQQHRGTAIILGTTDPDHAVRFLVECHIDAQRENGHVVIPTLPREQLMEITRQLVLREIGVYEITQRKNDLETIFMNLVNN